MGAVLIVLFALAFLMPAPAGAQPAGCPMGAAGGYGTFFTPPSYVEQFYWDGGTAFMLSKLPQEAVPNSQNVVVPSYHGSVNVPRATAQSYAQLKPSQTEQFYKTTVKPMHEALLTQQTTQSVECGLMLETTYQALPFILGRGGNLLLGKGGFLALAKQGDPVPGVNFLWTR